MKTYFFVCLFNYFLKISSLAPEIPFYWLQKQENLLKIAGLCCSAEVKAFFIMLP